MSSVSGVVEGSGAHRGGAAGPGSSDGDDPIYTVVETAYGYLYVVLIPSEGKLLYDAARLAGTAGGAEAALREALAGGGGGGEEPVAMPRGVGPEELLAGLMSALVQEQLA